MTVAETLAAFLIKTGYDDLPEQAFHMVGTIEDAREKAKTLAA